MKYTAVYGVTTATGKSGSLPGLSGQRTKARSKYGVKFPVPRVDDEELK